MGAVAARAASVASAARVSLVRLVRPERMRAIPVCLERPAATVAPVASAASGESVVLQAVPAAKQVQPVWTATAAMVARPVMAVPVVLALAEAPAQPDLVLAVRVSPVRPAEMVAPAALVVSVAQQASQVA